MVKKDILAVWNPLGAAQAETAAQVKVVLFPGALQHP